MVYSKDSLILITFHINFHINIKISVYWVQQFLLLKLYFTVLCLSFQPVFLTAHLSANEKSYQINHIWLDKLPTQLLLFSCFKPLSTTVFWTNLFWCSSVFYFNFWKYFTCTENTNLKFLFFSSETRNLLHNVLLLKYLENWLWDSISEIFETLTQQVSKLVQHVLTW